MRLQERGAEGRRTSIHTYVGVVYIELLAWKRVCLCWDLGRGGGMGGARVQELLIPFKLIGPWVNNYPFASMPCETPRFQ